MIMMYGKKFQGIVVLKYVCGVGDILTARYISEYLGVATVETKSIRKEAGFDGKFTYGMENNSTVMRNLMNYDEIIKNNHNKEIVIITGQKPFMCNKVDYTEHPDSDKLEDITTEELKEKFKENIELNKKKILGKTIKKELSFKDF